MSASNQPGAKCSSDGRSGLDGHGAAVGEGEGRAASVGEDGPEKRPKTKTNQEKSR
jgi:hypothetical protein